MRKEHADNKLGAHLGFGHWRVNREHPKGEHLEMARTSEFDLSVS